MTSIRQRRDTAAAWTAQNTVLLSGEIGVETDTGKLKIGDSITAWSSLSYSSTPFSVFGSSLVDDLSASAARVTLELDKRTTFSNAAYTVLTTDKVVAQIGTMSASRVVTLPAASAVAAGKEIVIADRSGTVTAANSLVITAAGSDTVNGGTTSTITSAYGERRLISDGVSAWYFDPSFLRQGLATTKGDLLAASAANTIARLAVGTDGYGLGADSAQTAGVGWSSVYSRVQEFNAQTGTTYTLVAGDAGKCVTLSNASAITLTVPQDSAATLPIGTYVDLMQLGAGQVTVAAGSGATLRVSGLTAKSYQVYARFGVQKILANTWVVMGFLAAS